VPFTRSLILYSIPTLCNQETTKPKFRKFGVIYLITLPKEPLQIRSFLLLTVLLALPLITNIAFQVRNVSCRKRIRRNLFHPTPLQAQYAMTASGE
jgi:hypothetical protein